MNGREGGGGVGGGVIMLQNKTSSLLLCIDLGWQTEMVQKGLYFVP